MTKIAKFFSTNFNKGDLYLIRISSLQSNLILVNYLTKYSIFSSKYLDYLDWKEVLNLIKNKEYKNMQENIEKLKEYKDSMNNKRKYFNNFYSL